MNEKNLYVHLHIPCSFTCLPYFIDSKTYLFHIATSLKLVWIYDLCCLIITVYLFHCYCLSTLGNLQAVESQIAWHTTYIQIFAEQCREMRRPLLFYPKSKVRFVLTITVEAKRNYFVMESYFLNKSYIDAIPLMIPSNLKIRVHIYYV